MLEAIANYENEDTMVEIADEHVITHKGRRKLRKTINGWKLKVAWINGSDTLLPLKYLKVTENSESALRDNLGNYFELKQD